jgi:hypothetical protein
MKLGDKGRRNGDKEIRRQGECYLSNQLSLKVPSPLGEGAEGG